jgi:hypothetical protein
MSTRILDILKNGKRDHELNEAAPKIELSEFIAQVDREMPEEYIEFLSTHNGGSGELPVQPCWYELWPTNEIVENNADYEAVNHLKDFFAIGSNQGGELIYIDYRENSKGKIVSIPLIPSEASYANTIANSFDELIPLLGLECRC